MAGLGIRTLGGRRQERDAVRKGGGSFRSKPSGARGLPSSAARRPCGPRGPSSLLLQLRLGHSSVSAGPKLVLWNFQGHVCYPFPRDSHSRAPSETSLFQMKLQLSFPHPAYTLCPLRPGNRKSRSVMLSAGVTGRGLRGRPTQFHVCARKSVEVQSGGG